MHNRRAVTRRHRPGLAPSRGSRSGALQLHAGPPAPRSPSLDTGTGGAEGAPAAMPGLAETEMLLLPIAALTFGSHFGRCSTPRKRTKVPVEGELWTPLPPALVSIHGFFSFPCFNFPSLCGCFNNIPSKSTEFLREAKVFVQRKRCCLSSAPSKTVLQGHLLLLADVQIPNALVNG